MRLCVHHPLICWSFLALPLVIAFRVAEAARYDRELFVMVGQMIRLFSKVAGLVMSSNDQPKHDVTTVDCIQRSDRVVICQLGVGAVEPDVFALLKAIATID